tara:strand:- start:302 stop:523 length:222 start_codon:yes stop_codon:yes gene_type:complete
MRLIVLILKWKYQTIAPTISEACPCPQNGNLGRKILLQGQGEKYVYHKWDGVQEIGKNAPIIKIVPATQPHSM